MPDYSFTVMFTVDPKNLRRDHDGEDVAAEAANEAASMACSAAEEHPHVKRGSVSMTALKELI